MEEMNNLSSRDEELEGKIKSEKEKVWSRIIEDVDTKAGINKEKTKGSSDAGKKVMIGILIAALAANTALSVTCIKKLNDNNKNTDKVVKILDEKEIYGGKEAEKYKKNPFDEKLSEENGVSDNTSEFFDDMDDALDAADKDTGEGENDIRIADNYVIRSTRKISDAYKSGDRSSLSDREKEVLDMAEKVIKEVIKPNMTDYEKEKAIYDWMTTNLAQDHGNLTVIPSSMSDADNPYGVLKYHNAVCVGYATTFRLFMHMLDIECKVVHNSECYHSWDLVRIDGDWYHTDIYSDVGRGGYQNFNLSDDMMGISQNWDRELFPTADSLKYNVMYQQAVKPQNIYDIPKEIRKAIDEKKSSLSYIFSEDKEKECIKAVKMITELTNRLNESYADKLFINVNVARSAEGILVAVCFSWYDDDDTTAAKVVDKDALSEEDKQKMEDAINYAFSDIIGDYTFYDN